MRRRAGNRRRGAAAGTLALLLIVGACRPEAPTGDPARLAEEVQWLLARGVAHAEIKEWPEARDLFARAAELAPDEPAALFDLALADWRLGQPAAARPWLDRIDPGAPAEARARVELLRGKLALEEGDVGGEADAYRRAAALAPSEPLYPYALAQVLPRVEGAEAQEEVGALLARAHELWPANSRLGAELAQWRLGRDDPESRLSGLELAERLAAGSGRRDVVELVARGRARLAVEPAEALVTLRRALNLLRPGKRFQKDSADLEARLQVMPYAEPLSAALRAEAPPREIALGFDPEALLPPLALAPDESLLQVVPFNDAVEPPAAARRQADLALLTDRALWFLDRGGERFERLAELAGGARQLLAGELDGDGRMEIVVLTGGGLRLFERSEAGVWSDRPVDPALAAAGLARGLLFDFEHDGDLDLLASGGDDRLLLVTHRGEAGWGPPQPAPLPLARSAGPWLATDLDGDADQDLLLADGDLLRVLVNWRQGEFAVAAELEAPAPLDQLVSLDRDGDGRLDVVGLAGGRLVVWRNGEDRGLVALETGGAPPAEPGPDEPAEIQRLAAGDADLDGDLDLVAAGHSADAGSGIFLLPTSPDDPRAAVPLVALDAGLPVGLALEDLDGDRAPDLLSWTTHGPATYRSRGAEGRLWLEVGLRGLAGKVPLDGRGARLTLSWGVTERVLEVERPELLLGLGDRPPALVKVTWPNGISEYLHAPAPGRRHVVEQVLRIEGSCPFLYASDGREMRFVTDILGLAPLGMLAAPGRYVEPDPEEYVRLPDWVAPQAGSWELRITEELREVAYLDQSELVAVDAPAEVAVYNGERWSGSPVRGLELRLLEALGPPIAARDDRGRDVLPLVAEADHRYLGHAGDRLYQGARRRHSLVLELPAEVAAAQRPALLLVGWLHWGNTSVNVARAQDPAGAAVFPYLEVPDGTGGWRRTEVEVGLPAGKTKPVVVDLAGALDPADPRVRITTDFEVYWDLVAAGRLLAPATTPHRIHRLAPAAAELRYGGFSRWYRPAPDGPYLFDYADRGPVPRRAGAAGDRPISWREQSGFYTRFGPVTELLADDDDRLAVFGAGEEVALTFDAASLPEPPPGWRRTLFLHSEGWEKDGDPNVACAETVGPLPRRGMARYPCPEGDETPAAGGEDRPSRWVDAERLERRVRSYAPRGR